MTGSAAPQRPPLLHIDEHAAIERLDARAWDALAPGQPLVSHAFLCALEESGCASARTGWQPCHLVARREGALVGAMPLYRKAHSYGEYVFDWGWADAYRRYGRRYYPKLVAAIPFTPATGPRLLGADDGVKRALLEAALETMQRSHASSLHVLFPDADDALACASRGMTLREGVQFRWNNAGYASFADFLGTFTRDKRKKVNQDRRRVRDAGVVFERRVGDAIGPADWDFFFACYESTYQAHHSTPYLTREFFARIAQAMPANLLMVLGRRGGERICAALDVFTASTLWGRYWGTTDFVPGLHFEACYYQAIEFCIEQRIAAFEGGAQGIHKLARGLVPVVTRSAHLIAEPAFAAAIADFCERERVDIAHTVDELGASSPFRHAQAADEADAA